MRSLTLLRPLWLLPLSLHRPPRLVLPAMKHTAGGSADELAALTVVKLKERLRELGRPVSGKKAELIARIMEPAPPPSSPPASSPPRQSSARAAIPMDPTPRRTSVKPSATALRAASWNVAGLRGLLKREEGCASLRSLVYDEGVDVLLLQETKLQES